MWPAPDAIDVVVAPDREALLGVVARGLAAGDGVVVAPTDATGLGAVAAIDPGSPRVVFVSLDDADTAPGVSATTGVPIVGGRGMDGFRWAVAWVRQRAAFPFTQLAYGDDADQIADLRLPDGDGPFPVAVFLHGGFWRERWLRDTIEPLAIDAAARGFASLNVEYRRAGPHFPGWHGTAADVGAALDHLAKLHAPLDLARVVVVGHSAGAQLAAWCVHRRPDGPTPASVRPAAVALLAGMVDLVELARRGIGDTGNPTTAFMGGGPAERAVDYGNASPLTLLPLGVPQIVVQGARDLPDLLDLSRVYVERARRAGDPVAYLEYADGDHFTVITPDRPEWTETMAAVSAVLTPQASTDNP